MITKMLHELAELHGIQLSYEDAGGVTRHASRDALEAVLTARHGKLTSETLKSERERTEASPLEPVNVVWLGERADIPIRTGRSSVEYELKLENGERHAGHEPVSNGRVSIPPNLPAGYHELTVDDRTAALFVAPRRIDLPGKLRTWGAFLPLYGAHTSRSWGLGDLTDLEKYREWIGELGGGVVATLPLLASFEDQPSPYSPVSRLFWNELYLDVEALPEFDLSDRDEETIAALRHSTHVDYERAHAMKRRLLQRMSKCFQPDTGFEAFAKHAGDYAAFRARRDAQRVSKIADSHAADMDLLRTFHLYAQYRMTQQMRRVADGARKQGHGLYLDFPLGVHPQGFDAERYASHFAKGVSVGAPPDLFFTKGQNWGFPPLDPIEARARSYNYFRAAVRHHTEHAGILRLDHVMGLHRLFWIPNGAEAREGVYVQYRADELYAIVAIEASRTGTMVVGEDLGTVPPYVPEAMQTHGLRRMFVVQYEVKPEGEQPTGTPVQHSVASINTHDMPTFAAFWEGADIDDRVAQDLLREDEAEKERVARARVRERLTAWLRAHDLLHHDTGDTFAVLQAVLAFLARSEAEIVLVNLEDLWLERGPQNVPGVPERSWKQKLRMSLEQSRQESMVKHLLKTVDGERRKIHGHSQ